MKTKIQKAMNIENKTNRQPHPAGIKMMRNFLILLCCLVFTTNNAKAQVFAYDENQDGLAPILIPGNPIATPTRASFTVNDCVSIGIVDAGDPDVPTERFNTVGYTNITVIPTDAGLAEFELFDIIYLPGTWASGATSYFPIIESNAADYIAYVEQGGRLFVEQPNPFMQPSATIIPTILPYPITFYNLYNTSDHPPIMVNPNHEILTGLSAQELSFPADQMIEVSEEYDVLVLGSVTESASLAVLEYGQGRIVVCSSNINSSLTIGVSDQYFLQMIQWLQPSATIDHVQACDSYTWIDGNTYTSDNNTATVVFADTAGCDSIVMLNLTIDYSSVPAVDVVSACGPYTWIDGVTYETNNNTATVTLMNSVGCDSLVLLDLTINELDLSITEIGPIMTSGTFDATYQWLECENGYVPIPGATEQSYAVTNDGAYAVIINLNGCIDTTECIQVMLSDVEHPLLNAVSIFPNPSDGHFAIDLGDLERPTVKVYSVLGQLVYEQVAVEQAVLELELDDVAGVYFVEVSIGDELHAFRVIVE